MFILIILIISLIVLFVIRHYFKRNRINVLNGFTGGNGSGKTSGAICTIVRFLRRYYLLRIFENSIIIPIKNLFRKKSNKLKKLNKYIILSSIPLGRVEKATSRRYIKTFGFKTYVYDLRVEVLLLLERVPQDEVIIFIDELSTIAHALDYAKPLVRDNLKEFFRLFRHYTNDKGLLIWTDQASDEVFNPLRRRTSFIYNMISSVKIPLLPIFIQEYRKILISEEIKNISDLNSSTSEAEIKRFIFFVNPFKLYNSCAYYHRYDLVDKITPLYVSDTLYRSDTLRLPEVKKLYYATLLNDGITAEDYLNKK